jgi:hypothetical protein
VEPPGFGTVAFSNVRVNTSTSVAGAHITEVVTAAQRDRERIAKIRMIIADMTLIIAKHIALIKMKVM